MCVCVYVCACEIQRRSATFCFLFTVCAMHLFIHEQCVCTVCVQWYLSITNTLGTEKQFAIWRFPLFRGYFIHTVIHITSKAVCFREVFTIRGVCYKRFCCIWFLFKLLFTSPSAALRQVDTMNLEFDTPLEAMHAPVKKLTATSSSAGQYGLLLHSTCFTLWFCTVCC